MNPIYLVQTCDESIVNDGGNCGDEKWIVWDDDTRDLYDTIDDAVKANTKFQEEYRTFEEMDCEEFNGEFITSESDYAKAYEVNAECVSVVKSWRTIAYFFSEEEAKRYIQYQSHNLTNPRTFAADCGYANSGDWDPFYELLQDIAKKCEVS